MTIWHVQYNEADKEKDKNPLSPEFRPFFRIKRRAFKKTVVF